MTLGGGTRKNNTNVDVHYETSTNNDEGVSLADNGQYMTRLSLDVTAWKNKDGNTTTAGSKILETTTKISEKKRHCDRGPFNLSTIPKTVVQTLHM